MMRGNSQHQVHAEHTASSRHPPSLSVLSFPSHDIIIRPGVNQLVRALCNSQTSVSNTRCAGQVPNLAPSRADALDTTRFSCKFLFAEFRTQGDCAVHIVNSQFTASYHSYTGSIALTVETGPLFSTCCERARPGI
ncbi:hypothetical protein NM688_g6005 [Phlebia brevispora]|uniref:Uncharacterized protein n=1 Tax=Phlebia brevispora TaxID=194682 RepID=A0ACC1SL67_9APHY|nr:hypothetical protein NM688_g6005 [Phlebia brevispora]